MNTDYYFRFIGLDTVAKTLTDYAGNFRGAAGRALHAEAQIEMTEAKRRTPVDTGALRSSGIVQPPQGGLGMSDRGDITVAMAFGGPSAGYGLIVHEDLEAIHPVGQAKYLESTVLEAAPFLAQRVANRMQARREAAQRGVATRNTGGGE